MTDQPSDDTEEKKIVLRIQKGLKTKIERLAQKERRSVNAQIIVLLERAPELAEDKS